MNNNLLNISREDLLALEGDKFEEHIANFLVPRFSNTSLNVLSTNPIRFEKEYICGIRDSLKTAALCVGDATHKCAETYFRNIKEGLEPTTYEEFIVQGTAIIKGIPQQKLYIAKKNTYEEQVNSIIKDFSKCAKSFFEEKTIYEFDEILEVEEYNETFVSIDRDVEGKIKVLNVPIPLACKIDFVSKKDKKITIWDHKSKTSAFTKPTERKVSYGKQAFLMMKDFETRTGLTVDEIVFVEIKGPRNADKSPQLEKTVFIADNAFRKLYSALLYQEIISFIEAVSDPHREFEIRKDMYMTEDEALEFWIASRMPSDMSSFIPPRKGSAMEKRLKSNLKRNLKLANFNLEAYRDHQKKVIIPNYSKMKPRERIEFALQNHGAMVTVDHVINGASVDVYLLIPDPTTTVTSIKKREKELALALGVSAVRVALDLFEYESKYYLKVEVAKNGDRQFFDYEEAQIIDGKIPVGVGVDGNQVYWDPLNPSTPHVLVCGSTGSGKSIFLESLGSLLREAYEDSQIIVLDPKMLLGDALKSVADEVYSDISNIETYMGCLLDEMEQLIKGRVTGKKMFIIFDEFADAYDNARTGEDLKIKHVQTGARGGMKSITIGVDKSLQKVNRMILQKGRSAGIHMIMATQRASSKIISGDAKANLTVQIAFKLQKEIDSRVVIDETGAEALLGKGDGLMRSPDYPGLIRFQAFKNKSCI